MNEDEKLLGDSVNASDDATLIEETLVPKPTIGLLQLAVLAYFITCGGPFGFEPVIGSAGAVWSIGGLICIVALWCLPQG